MPSSSSWKIITFVFAIGAVSIGIFFVVNPFPKKHTPVILESAPIPLPVPIVAVRPEHKVIGTSVAGRDIEVYSYGDGDTHLLFVGGMHGGYEWNSVLLAYEFIDHLRTQPNIISKNLTISVIPSLNPDGLYKVIGKEGRFTIAEVPTITTQKVGTGRFNAHNVDLNRNFDCKWKSTGMWRGQVVSAGSAPFSEPEAIAIRDFVLNVKPTAVVFWHSQANAVYASECKNGILPETLSIMYAYANASGYTPVKSFDAYVVNGDAEGWLASIGIPAITVELKNHETVEWEKNIAGITGLLNFYKQKDDMPNI